MDDLTRRITLDRLDDGGRSSGPRPIQIYLPAGYHQSDERYPTLYFLDGGGVFSYRRMDMLQVDLAYDDLIAQDKIRPAIIVAVFNHAAGSAQDGRIKDLSPTASPERPGSGGLPGFYRYISEVLKPWIDANYRTLPEPASTGIAGASLGGLAAFVMAHEHPETFGMAGCMSSAFYWHGEYAIGLARRRGDKRPVRYWLDGGGGEMKVWRQAAEVYESLERRGWIPGDDLAAFFDYPANHDQAGQRGRMRDMLQFLLRKEPYRLTGYRLVHAASPDDDCMDLGIGFRRIVGAEALYQGGARLTVPNPSIEVDEPKIVLVDVDNALLLHQTGQGETTIRSTYGGYHASLRVVGADLNTTNSDLPCRRIVDIADFDKIERPHAIADVDGREIATFGVGWDDEHIYIAVRVFKDVIVGSPDKAAWEQDSVEFRFDPRAESALRDGEGYNEEDDEFLTVVLAPSASGEPTAVYPPKDEWASTIADDTRGTCLKVDGGFDTLLCIPVTYVERIKTDHWEVFRLNVCINWADPVDGSMTDRWWQPNWFEFRSKIGSGIFRRA